MKYACVALIALTASCAHAAPPTYPAIVENVASADGGGWIDAKRQATDATCEYRLGYVRVYGNLPGMSFCYYREAPDPLASVNAAMRNLPGQP